MQTAPQIAQGAVALVKKKFGFQLNYDPPSLIVIDLLVDKIKETGASEHQASGLLLGLGCYVGEVFVRHARASWRETAQMGMTRTCAYPIILALPGARRRATRSASSSAGSPPGPRRARPCCGNRPRCRRP